MNKQAALIAKHERETEQARQMAKWLLRIGRGRVVLPPFNDDNGNLMPDIRDALLRAAASARTIGLHPRVYFTAVVDIYAKRSDIPIFMPIRFWSGRNAEKAVDDWYRKQRAKYNVGKEGKAPDRDALIDARLQQDQALLNQYMKKFNGDLPAAFACTAHLLSDTYILLLLKKKPDLRRLLLQVLGEMHPRKYAGIEDKVALL